MIFITALINNRMCSNFYEVYLLVLERQFWCDPCADSMSVRLLMYLGTFCPNIWWCSLVQVVQFVILWLAWMHVWGAYLALQNIPSTITLTVTLGNKVILHCKNIRKTWHGIAYIVWAFLRLSQDLVNHLELNWTVITGVTNTYYNLCMYSNGNVLKAMHTTKYDVTQADTGTAKYFNNPALIYWSNWKFVSHTYCRILCNPDNDSTIGRFSEAGLLEWMSFVIFQQRSRERSQRTYGLISE